MNIDKQEIKENIYTLLQLSKRNIKIFLKDKVTVFFSLLAPMIILLLYILFLADLQISTVKTFFPEGIVVEEKAIKAFVDSWMISGVLAVACITVSLSANSVMVQDRTKGFLQDSLSSPVKKWVITFSYFLYNFIITVMIVFVVFVVCLIYLAASGSWHLSIGDIFGIIGVILISTFSSTLITVFISRFFKTEGTLSAFVGICSAILGFLIGAYMPISVMPKFAQHISGVIPGSHSAGLFRHFLMSGALENLGITLPTEAVNGLASAFSMEIEFLGMNIGINGMTIYLLASIVIFLVLTKVVSFKKKFK